MSGPTLIIWSLFVAFVVFRSVRYFRMKRYGWAIALLFVALFVGYEAAMQWRTTPTPSATAPALPEPPADAYRDETQPRGTVELGPPPQAPPSED